MKPSKTADDAVVGLLDAVQQILEDSDRKSVVIASLKSRLDRLEQDHDALSKRFLAPKSSDFERLQSQIDVVMDRLSASDAFIARHIHGPDAPRALDPLDVVRIIDNAAPIRDLQQSVQSLDAANASVERALEHVAIECSDLKSRVARIADKSRRAPTRPTDHFSSQTRVVNDSGTGDTLNVTDIVMRDADFAAVVASAESAARVEAEVVVRELASKARGSRLDCSRSCNRCRALESSSLPSARDVTDAELPPLGGFAVPADAIHVPIPRPVDGRTRSDCDTTAATDGDVLRRVRDVEADISDLGARVGELLAAASATVTAVGDMEARWRLVDSAVDGTRSRIDQVENAVACMRDAAVYASIADPAPAMPDSQPLPAAPRSSESHAEASRLRVALIDACALAERSSILVTETAQRAIKDIDDKVAVVLDVIRSTAEAETASAVETISRVDHSDRIRGVVADAFASQMDSAVGVLVGGLLADASFEARLTAVVGDAVVLYGQGLRHTLPELANTRAMCESPRGAAEAHAMAVRALALAEAASASADAARDDTSEQLRTVGQRVQRCEELAEDASCAAARALSRAASAHATADAVVVQAAAVDVSRDDVAHARPIPAVGETIPCESLLDDLVSRVSRRCTALEARVDAVEHAVRQAVHEADARPGIGGSPGARRHDATWHGYTEDSNRSAVRDRVDALERHMDDVVAGIAAAIAAHDRRLYLIDGLTAPSGCLISDVHDHRTPQRGTLSSSQQAEGSGQARGSCAQEPVGRWDETGLSEAPPSSGVLCNPTRPLVATVRAIEGDVRHTLALISRSVARCMSVSAAQAAHARSAAESAVLSIPALLRCSDGPSGDPPAHASGSDRLEAHAQLSDWTAQFELVRECAAVASATADIARKEAAAAAAASAAYDTALRGELATRLDEIDRWLMTLRESLQAQMSATERVALKCSTALFGSPDAQPPPEDGSTLETYHDASPPLPPPLLPVDLGGPVEPPSLHNPPNVPPAADPSDAATAPQTAAASAAGSRAVTSGGLLLAVAALRDASSSSAADQSDLVREALARADAADDRLCAVEAAVGRLLGDVATALSLIREGHASMRGAYAQATAAQRAAEGAQQTADEAAVAANAAQAAHTTASDMDATIETARRLASDTTVAATNAQFVAAAARDAAQRALAEMSALRDDCAVQSIGVSALASAVDRIQDSIGAIAVRVVALETSDTCDSDSRRPAFLIDHTGGDIRARAPTEGPQHPAYTHLYSDELAPPVPCRACTGGCGLRIAALEAAVASLRASVGAADERSVSHRVDGLAGDVTAVGDAVVELSERFTVLDRALSVLRVHVDGHAVPRDNLSRNEAVVPAHTTCSLTPRVLALERHMELGTCARTRSPSELITELNKVSNLANCLQRELVAVRSDVTNMTDQISTMALDAISTVGRADSLVARIGGVERHLDAQLADITRTVEKSVACMLTGQEALARRIDASEASLSSVLLADTRANERFDSLLARVSSVELASQAVVANIEPVRERLSKVDAMAKHVSEVLQQTSDEVRSLSLSQSALSRHCDSNAGQLQSIIVDMEALSGTTRELNVRVSEQGESFRASTARCVSTSASTSLRLDALDRRCDKFPGLARHSLDVHHSGKAAAVEPAQQPTVPIAAGSVGVSSGGAPIHSDHTSNLFLVLSAAALRTTVESRRTLRHVWARWRSALRVRHQRRTDAREMELLRSDLVSCDGAIRGLEKEIGAVARLVEEVGTDGDDLKDRVMEIVGVVDGELAVLRTAVAQIADSVSVPVRLGYHGASTVTDLPARGDPRARLTTSPSESRVIAPPTHLHGGGAETVGSGTLGAASVFADAAAVDAHPSPDLKTPVGDLPYDIFSGDASLPSPPGALMSPSCMPWSTNPHKLLDSNCGGADVPHPAPTACSHGSHEGAAKAFLGALHRSADGADSHRGSRSPCSPSRSAEPSPASKSSPRDAILANARSAAAARLFASRYHGSS